MLRLKTTIVMAALFGLGMTLWTEISIAQEKSKSSRRSRTQAAVKSEDYPTPLYLDSTSGAMALPPMQFEYDLSQDGGKTLIVGPSVLNGKTFYFQLATMASKFPQAKSLASGEANKLALIIKWPEGLLRYGTLEMISRNGQVTWTHEITQKDRSDWVDKIEKWKKSLKIGPKSKVPEFLTTSISITDLKSKGAPFATAKDWFRFCISESSTYGANRLCSDRYMMKRLKGRIVMTKEVAEAETPRALVRNEEAPNKDVVDVPVGAPLQFYADLASGMSYEFVSSPPVLNIADITATKNSEVLRIVGWDVLPVGVPYRIINREQYGMLTEFLGFQPTIKDTRRFWEAPLRVDPGVMYFPGTGGGVFKQRFDFDILPRDASKAYLHKDTPKGSYSDSITLELKKHPNAKATSDQWAVEDTKDANFFEWKFKASEPGEMNRSYLNLVSAGKTYRQYFEVYRSYANELSGRFSGILSSGNFVIMGEALYSRWFESLLGMDNYYISRQRWGIAAKYFRSINQLPIDDAGNKETLDVTVVDLKYRLSPGLWTRDETLGLMGSYQSLNFGDLKTPMMGGGIFWARSMPKVFDWLFNYLPYMDYPKWVDMEFIYYTTALKANVRLTSSYSLNFHGQVLWKKNLFGEAGFGMKRYAFSDDTLGKKAELNTFYGTLGLGIKF